MDAATFGQEAMRYERLLYHICWAMTGNDADCADIIQEALLRAWQHRDALRSMASFRPWLCRITANTCRDLLRKRKKLKMVPLTDTLMAPPYSDDPLALREALAKLSPDGILQSGCIYQPPAISQRPSFTRSQISANISGAFFS